MTTQKLFSFIAHVFLPNQCMFCSTSIAYDQTICEKCMENAPLTCETGCLVCGKQNCSCIGRLFSELICPFYYEMGADNAVKDLKFNNNRFNAKKLTLYMADVLLNSKLFHEIDLILPVPLHRFDYKKRGYNQAELLARHLSKYVDVSMLSNVLIKYKKTSKQHDLNFNQRQSNLIDAFQVKNCNLIEDKTVLLVDDVFTTGATMNACTSILLQSGAKKVVCITATKTRNINKTTRI